MDFNYLYLKRDGRISRKTFWMGALGLIVPGGIVAVVVAIAAVVLTEGDRDAGKGIMTLAMIGLSLLLSYPAYCLAVKRRHDCDNNGLDILALSVFNIVWGAVMAVSLLTGSPEAFFKSPLYQVVHSIGQFAGVYAVVVLGAIKGSKGHNMYGPDPLARFRAASAET